MNDQDRLDENTRPQRSITHWTKIFGFLSREQPPEKEVIDHSFSKGCLTMRKGPADTYYLMCMFSNKYRDRDYFAAPKRGGQIISDAAHRNYVKFLDENPELAPELWSLHIPGTERRRRAHWWDYDGAIVYAEFELDEDEAAGVKAFADLYEPGLSHGFYMTKYDKEFDVIEEYYSYEISILPLEWAANPWTTFELIRKELDENMGKFTPERRAALVALHGEKFVQALEQKGDQLRNLLDELEIDNKELSDSQEDESEDTQEETEESNDVATSADVVKALESLHSVISADLKAIIERLDDLEERLDDIEDDQDEAKSMAMPASVLASWQPGSVVGQDETIIETRDPLRKKAPKQVSRNNGHMLSGLFASFGSDDDA